MERLFGREDGGGVTQMRAMYESCARVCGHDAHLCATADEDAGTSNGGAVAETPSEMDSSDTSESDKEEVEAEAVITAPIIVGQKISLIDGHGKTWATTFVIDIEPKMPPDWHADGKIGEYILVRGGVALPEATANGVKPMSVASN